MGSWDKYFLGQHMNILELQAVFLSLKSCLVPLNAAVRVFSDNSTTVQALLKQGSSRSVPVTKVVSQIFFLCQERNLTLYPHKIPGKLNVLADALSRNTALPGEWELHPQDRENLLHLFPNMEVDLMATPYNAVLKTFVSPFYHPQSSHVDAWSLDWNQWEDVYLFPPPSQVHKVFTALRSFQGKMTLILRAHPLLMPPRDLPKPLSVVGPLLHPPRQLVRGEWIPDGRHLSSPWTVHRY